MQLATDGRATSHPDPHAFLQYVPNRAFLIGNVVLAIGYTLVISFAFEHGNPVLFTALILTELFHLAQIIGYCYTVWRRALLAVQGRAGKRAVSAGSAR